MSSRKWSCIINAIYPWIHNLHGADPPGLPVSPHSASMHTHTTVENAFRCQRVAVNQSLLWPPHLFPSPQGGNVLCFILSSHHLFLLKEQALFCLGLLQVALGGRGGGILSRGLWGKPHSWFLSTPRTMVSQRYHKQRKVMQPCVMGAGPIFMPRFWISWRSKALWTTGIIHCTRYQMPNTDFLKSTWETNQNDLLKKKKGSYRYVFNNNRAGNFALLDIYPAYLPAGIPQVHLNACWATWVWDTLRFHKPSKVSWGQRLDKIPLRETPLSIKNGVILSVGNELLLQSKIIPEPGTAGVVLMNNGSNPSPSDCLSVEDLVCFAQHWENSPQMTWSKLFLTYLPPPHNAFDDK